MTQEEANKEYRESLKELEAILVKAHSLSYRLHHGAAYYNQPKAVVERGERVWTELANAEETLLEFLEDLPNLQKSK